MAQAFTDAGGDSSDLDDVVFDVAGSYGASAANGTDDEVEQEAAISAFEAQASEINNRSTAEQVAAILMVTASKKGNV